ITNANSYIIASDSSRDEILASSEVMFTLNTNGSVLGSYTVGFQLLDKDDNIVPLDHIGVSAPDYIRRAGVQVVDLNDTILGENTTNQVYAIGLKPMVPLNAHEEYTVRAILHQFCFVDTNFTLVATTNTMESAGQEFFHFDSTDTADAAVNVFAEASNVIINDRFAIDSVPTNDTFEATVFFQTHRFDNFANLPEFGPVNFSAQYTMRDSSSNPVGSGIRFFSRVLQSHDGVIPSPIVQFFSYDFDFQPNTQLDPVTETYTLEVIIRHQEEPPGGLYIGGSSQTSTAARYDHYSGVLMFNDISTTITGLDNDPPMFGFLISNEIHTVMSISTGHLTTDAGYTYSNTGPLQVRVDTNGIAHLRSNDLSTVDLVSPIHPMNELDTLNNISFQRAPDMSLDREGLRATIRAFMPAGTGYSHTQQAQVYKSLMPFSDVFLNQQLKPRIDPVYDNGTTFMAEESKPVLIQTTQVTWDVDTGRLRWTPLNASHSDKDELDYLATTPGGVNKTVKSNLGYYQHTAGLAADSTGENHIETDADGTGLLNTAVNIAPGSFQPHFPQGATLTWTLFTNSVHIVDDILDTSKSKLGNASAVNLNYAQGCTDVDCGDPESQQGNLTVTPS
ncbi:MAG: hypothetical protein AAF492_15050, partial [Verrucomicrobiota bacterium]